MSDFSEKSRKRMNQSCETHFDCQQPRYTFTPHHHSSSSIIIMLYHQTTFARRELIDDERTAHLCERTQYVDPRNRLDQPHHVECLHFSRVATAAVLLLFLSPKIPRDHHTSSSNIHYHHPCQFHPGPSYLSIFNHHLWASIYKK